eukprot:7525242-Pyramimonas_sp.AAC.1
MSHITNCHDPANAFASSSWSCMSTTTHQMFRPGSESFGHQRYPRATVTLAGCDCDITLRPGCGGLVGDGFAARSFVHTFAPVVE